MSWPAVGQPEVSVPCVLVYEHNKWNLPKSVFMGESRRRGRMG